MTTTAKSTNGTAIIRPIRPAADVIERATDWVVLLDVPGVDETQLEVVLAENELRVGAPLRLTEREGDQPVQRERSRGIYMRSFRLGEEADPSGIDAELRHGVLALTVRKSAKAIPRRIPVRLGEQQERPPSST